jgi:hypothetical protein
MFHRLIGMWVLRRAWRLLTADDPRPIKERLTREAKRILVGAAITVALLFVGAIALIALLIALAT